MISIKKVWVDRSHPIWVLAQQVVLRGAVALKFLILARLLGPEAVGLVGIAMIALSAAESLTDTGLVPAIVQRFEHLTREQESAAWTVLMLRGVAIGTLLILTSPLTATFLRAPDAVGLLAWAAGTPMFRGVVSLGVYYAQRKRDFKTLTFLQAASSLLDLIAALFFILMGFGAISAIWSSLVAEGVRVLLSYKLFPQRVRLSFFWTPIEDLLQYGRWVWGSSGLTFLLKQIDKIIVARYFGATNLGIYQISYKMAQLTIFDAMHAYSQYLFPTFAETNRRSHTEAKRNFGNSMLLITWYIAALVAPFILGARGIIVFLLGDKWNSAVPLFRVLVLAMGFESLKGIAVVYLRAIGRPQYVTFSFAVQLLFQIALGIILVTQYGAIGMAWALVISAGASFTLLLYLTERHTL